jgi:hypothetical protein
MDMKYIFRSTFEGAKREDNIVTGVHILGFNSKNGYTYSPDAVQKAAPLYEGKPVYEEHSRARKVSDILGTFENVKFVSEIGLVGDFKMNPKHLHYEQFKWNADNTPKVMGMSHAADIKVNESKKLVMDIANVESVDLVATPATVDGLYAHVTEGVIADKVNQDTEMNKLRTLVYAAHSLTSDVMYNGAGTDGEKAKKIRKIHGDLVSELKNHYGDEAKESVSMDRATLLKDHPELVDAIRQEAVAAERKVQESLKKVPKELCTSVFESLVRKCSTDAEVDALVADRIAMGTVTRSVVEEVVASAARDTKISSVKVEESAKAVTKDSTLALLGAKVKGK